MLIILLCLGGKEQIIIRIRIIGEVNYDMDVNRKWNNGFSKQVYRETAGRFLRNLAFGPDNQMRKYTFFILLFFGLAGVLIDLDHLIIEETQMVRPLHLPIWIGVWIMCIGYYAYIHRRFHKSCMKTEK